MSGKCKSLLLASLLGACSLVASNALAADQQATQQATDNATQVATLTASDKQAATNTIQLAQANAGNNKAAMPLPAKGTSHQQVIDMAQNAVLAVYNYDYKTMQEKLKKSSLMFSKHGWQQFIAAMKRSGNLQAVQQKQLTVSSRLAAQPKLVTHRVISGYPVWVVQVPLYVTYRSPQGQQVYQSLAVVAAVTKYKNSKGEEKLGISQVIARVIPPAKRGQQARPQARSQANPKQAKPVTQ